MFVKGFDWINFLSFSRRPLKRERVDCRLCSRVFPGALTDGQHLLQMDVSGQGGEGPGLWL